MASLVVALVAANAFAVPATADTTDASPGDAATTAVAASYMDAIPDGALVPEVTVQDALENSVGVVTLNQVTDDYKATAAEAITPEPGTNDQVAPQWTRSGNGGTGSASGCRTVTVTLTQRTLLGFVAYKYHTHTRFCWNRSAGTISNVTYGWDISNVDSQEYWQGIINKAHNYYTWSAGHSHSGHYDMIQGQMNNCILKYGCIATFYPTNEIWVHSNGTWSWNVED